MINKLHKNQYFIDFFVFCFKIRNEKMPEGITTIKIK